MGETKSGKTVAVIGAGMGGLLAARVLADRFEHVVVIDRDTLPTGPDPRKGVPQGRHAHGLLGAGERVIRDQFPGLMEALVDGGAQKVTTQDVRWWQGGGYRVKGPGPDNTFLSRPYLERGVRGRVEQIPNVTFVNERVEGLRFNDGSRVVGVNDYTTDLVVDCSGRASQVGRWLAGAGYPEPPVAQVQINMGYASRLYRRTTNVFPAGVAPLAIGTPPSKRLGVAFPIEGDRWIVTLAGMHGDHAPTDDAGFLAYAESLPTDDIAAVIRAEEPLTDITTHRLQCDQWRHFEKLSRHPAGFVALGDSICSFNPIYGQGMSSAAQQAVALGGVVDRDGPTSAALPGRFYKAAAKVIANPWAIAAGGDFVFPETTGDKPPMVDRINKYVARVIVAAQHDPVVASAMWDVQNLLAPPPSLMRPTLIPRVLRASRKGPTGAESKAVATLTA